MTSLWQLNIGMRKTLDHPPAPYMFGAYVLNEWPHQTGAAQTQVIKVRCGVAPAGIALHNPQEEEEAHNSQ